MDQPSEANNTTRRIGFRFSLQTMFFVLVIAVLAWSHWVTPWRLFDLQQRFQKEQGLLIEDELKVYVFGEETFVPQTWQWKVYLPPGRYAVHANFVSVPRTGLPENNILSTEQLLGGRVYTVHVGVRRAVDGTWQLRLIADYGHGVRGDLDYIDPQPDVEKIGRDFSYRGVGTHPSQTREYERGETVILMHYRVDRSVPVDDERNRNRKPPPTEEGLGVMAWINPITRPADAGLPMIDAKSSPTYFRRLQRKQAEKAAK